MTSSLMALLLATTPMAGAPQAIPAVADTAPATAIPEIPPGLRLTEETVQPPIAVPSLEDFVAVIRGQQSLPGGGSVPVRTSSDLQVGYKLVPGEGGGCTIERIDIGLHVVQSLPMWQPPESVRATFREQWLRMEAGMRVHERGHRDNAVAMGIDLLQRLQALAAQPHADCDEANRLIVRERHKAQVRYQTRDAAYDRRTRHGLNQAPPPPPPKEDRSDLRRRAQR